ncbi:MAG: glycosyltransferase family 2 protein [Nitrososphaerota archaeon]
MQKVSVIIPAHNEEDNLDEAVTRVDNLLSRARVDGEIIVVDDNSTDSTPKLADLLAAKIGRVRVVHRTDGMKGFGMAIRSGIEAARGDYVVPFMADLSDDPEDILKLLRKVKEGYDIVIGSRFISGGRAYGYSFMKLIANRLYNFFLRMLFGLKLKDSTNAFKLYNRKLLSNLKLESKGFEINAEIIIKAYLMGAKIAEIPTEWRERGAGKSKMKLLKVWKDYGLTAIRLFLRHFLQR